MKTWDNEGLMERIDFWQGELFSLDYHATMDNRRLEWRYYNDSNSA